MPLIRVQQSNQRWLDVTNTYLPFYIGALLRIHATVTQAFALNCRLCLDRQASLRVHISCALVDMQHVHLLRDYELLTSRKRDQRFRILRRGEDRATPNYCTCY